jgi:hypothetical protein
MRVSAPLYRASTGARDVQALRSVRRRAPRTSRPIGRAVGRTWEGFC